jgi:signal transduction histidine kinase
MTESGELPSSGTVRINISRSSLPPASALGVGPRQSVLIADDSRVVRTKLVSILETLDDVEVRVAANGLEALSLAKEKKPDLLLSDQEMPGMSGIQLLRVLRKTWSRFELPVLMLTANSATDTKVVAFQNGANDYVTKPVEPAELCARVLAQLDLKRAIDQNLEARVQLLEARKYQAVGRLASGVAHELNNPAQYTSSNLSYLKKSAAAMCGALGSALEWAKNPDPDPAFAQQFLEQCRALNLAEVLAETPAAVDEALDGIRRMAAIITEMKDFAGDPLAETGELELNLAIRNTVEVSRSMWESVVHVSLDLHPELPPVRGAAHLIKQAFLNLLTNAVEAVAGQRRDPGAGRVSIVSSPVDGGVEVRFRDDGPGIPAEVQPKIFEPFFTTKPVGQGTGQGLFIAYAIIVEQCQGKLRCESRPGRGATFKVWLPSASRSGRTSLRSSL